jgi:hypothetical protein
MFGSPCGTVQSSSDALSMTSKIARPTRPLAGFGRSNPEERANRKTFRAFFAAAALLASGCSGGAGAGAPITPISGGGTGASITPNGGSVAAPTVQSILPQSVGSSNPYSAAVLASSPAAYFRLDDTGTSALDSSGNGHNMTIGSAVSKGAAGLVAGDAAVTLSGVGGNAAAVITSSGRSSSLEPATTVSLEAWIKPAAMPSSGRAVIAAYGDDDVNAPYELFLLSTTQLVWKLDVSGGQWLTSKAKLSVGSTYHVVGTYDGATMRLYINGALDNSLATSGSIGNYAYANRNLGFTIGEDGHLIDGSFKGVVDEVAVYTRALSGTDVSNHYAAASNAPTASPTPAPTPTPTPKSTPAPTPTPKSTPAPTPTPPHPTPTPVPTPTAEPNAPGVHMLDDTGCQDFPSNSILNTSLANAPVDANSAAQISQAARYATGGLGITGSGPNGIYQYAVVPMGQPLVSVSQKVSYHTIPGFPIPSYGASLPQTGDAVMSLVEKTNAPANCTGWEGYSFSPSWSAYSGDTFSFGAQMKQKTCDGVASFCGMDLGGNLTTWETNHGATNPILHTIHAESPSGMTCDVGGGSCISSQRIRLHANYPMPSDPNAKAVLQALKTYGATVDDNGCCWELRVMNNYNEPESVPSTVRGALSTLRVTDFDAVDPPYSI